MDDHRQVVAAGLVHATHFGNLPSFHIRSERYGLAECQVRRHGEGSDNGRRRVTDQGCATRHVRASTKPLSDRIEGPATRAEEGVPLRDARVTTSPRPESSFVTP